MEKSTVCLKVRQSVEKSDLSGRTGYLVILRTVYKYQLIVYMVYGPDLSPVAASLHNVSKIAKSVRLGSRSKTPAHIECCFFFQPTHRVTCMHN